MRYVAAYLLAVLGGKESPSEGDIEKILDSVGVNFEKSRISDIVGKLKGKSIDDLIAEGSKKMASMPSGGGGAAAGGGASGGGDAAKAEEKKEEAKKEESEESDDDMGFGLFD